jgi:N-acetylglucosamine-6-phosphate deacetylase
MGTSLVGGRVLLDDGLHDGVAVTIEGDRIVAVGEPIGDERIDLAGAILAPGFVDLQVNGGGDVMLNDSPDAATMARIADAHLQFGVTSLLPTLISDDLAKSAAAIAALNAADIPGVIGLHLEGPFLSPARKGAHDPAHFRPPDDAALALLTSLRRGKMLVTLAPDVAAPPQIARLVAAGVVVAAGHSAATYDQVRAALDAGLSGFTHLFNAMSPLGSRAPGMVGAALEDRGSWCGIIVDGHHVHPAALKIALAAKPKGSVLLVTDAMGPVGGISDNFVLNGERIERRNGVFSNGRSLAGSCLDMATAVRNAIRLLDVEPAEALRMASLYPARAMGLEQEIGAIAPGRRADLVLMDDHLLVQQVWRAGARAKGKQLS